MAGKQGFASMNEDRRREIASMGGSASPGNFKNDPQRASEAGKKGAAAQPHDAKVRGGQNSHRG